MFSDRLSQMMVAEPPTPTGPSPGFMLMPQQPQAANCPWLYLQAFETACREVYAAKRARLLEPCWN